eukprot:4519988-Amphidinium_carterae.1
MRPGHVSRYAKFLEAAQHVTMKPDTNKEVEGRGISHQASVNVLPCAVLNCLPRHGAHMSTLRCYP